MYAKLKRKYDCIFKMVGYIWNFGMMSMKFKELITVLLCLGFNVHIYPMWFTDL